MGFLSLQPWVIEWLWRLQELRKPKRTTLQSDFPGAQSTVRVGQGLAKQSFRGNALAVACSAHSGEAEVLVPSFQTELQVEVPTPGPLA